MALSGIKKSKRTKVAPEEAAIQSHDSEEASGDDASEASVEGNAGWADSIAKVLRTNPKTTTKTLVLSRAKKIKPGGNKTKSKRADDCGFELAEGEVKEEKPDKAQLDEKSKQRKNLTLALRVKPSWRDMERERTLRKVATRGVVQLFNAVRIQQKDLQFQLEEAGPLDSKKEAIMNNINKRKFLDVLMTGNRAKSQAIDNAVKDEAKKEEETSSDEDTADEGKGSKRKSEWSVLRDDFMTNKKIKHWDEEDEEEAGNANSESEDDE